MTQAVSRAQIWVRARMPGYPCIYIYIYIYTTLTYPHTDTLTLTYIYIYIYICIHAHSYRYARTYMNMHCCPYKNFVWCMIVVWTTNVYSHYSHNHIIIIMISQSNGTCTNSNTLTGELTVVQIRTFINFLTSEFGSSTWGERNTILKSLSYRIMLTKLKRSAHLVEF